MGEVRFRVLGQVQVLGPANDYRPLTVSRMPRTLLAALIFEGPGRVVPVQRLSDSLWDQPPPSAGSNLRTYRTRLQRELDRMRLANRIVGGSHGGYALQAGATEVDVLVFRDLTATARRHLRNRECEAAVALLGKALALWRGAAGEDLPRTRRLRALADCLDGERAAATEALCRAAIQCGDHQKAIGELDRHLVDHPTRETGWVLLACAHYLHGNPALAQAKIRRGSRELADTVGLGPSPDLVVAESAAVRHDGAWFHRYVLDAA